MACPLLIWHRSVEIDMTTARLSSPGCANRLSVTMVSAARLLLWPRMLTVLLAEMVTYMKVSGDNSRNISASHANYLAGSRQGMPDRICLQGSSRLQQQAHRLTSTNTQ
jgi:hypothetical protein